MGDHKSSFRRNPARWLLLAVLVLCVLSVPLCADDDPGEAYFAKARHQMVDRDLVGRGITNDRVLTAMKTVPREDYVLDRYRRQAYADSPLPIDEAQTISQPYIVAAMTEALQLEPDDAVLEVGTGSGYQAAILAEIVLHVFTIEIIQPLAEKAEQTLKAHGYTNISVRAGDGYQGWPESAPFDAIVVTAAPDHVPEPLLEQLKPGGRMVIPVGKNWATQELVVIRKNADGTIEQTSVMPVRFVPLTGEGVQSRGATQQRNH